MEETLTTDSRQNEVLAVATLFFVLSWLTTVFRFYVRGKLRHNWGADDSFMGATLLLFTIYLAFQTVTALYGTGQHRWNLKDSDARTALLFWYICELFYVLANCAFKIAIGYFYLRVAVQRWHVLTIKTLMGCTILFTIVYFFLAVFQCIPVSEFWNIYPASEKCLSARPKKGITYAFAGVNTTADWVLGILPVFIVRNLQMKLKTKVLVVGILAFAAIGSTATIVRMFYIHTIMDGPDFLYATTDLAIWSTVELGIGITASSVATLRPLVQCCLGRLRYTSASGHSHTYCLSNSEKKRKDRRGYRRSFGPPDLVPTQRSGVTWTEIQGPKPTTVISMSCEGMVTLPSVIVDQEDYIQTPDGHILQTTTLQQEYGAAS